MSNHKWNKENKCVHCGIERQKAEHTVYGIPYSVLGRDGCWYDKVPERTNFEYKYKVGGKWQWHRPDCYEGWLLKVKKEQNNYPTLKGKVLNDEILKDLFVEQKAPIDALNTLMDLT